MKKFLLAALLLISPVLAQADDEEITLEPTNKYVATAKMVVDYFDPSIDQVYFMKNGSPSDGEWSTGLSASIYTFDSQELDLLSVRLGYIPENEHRFYGGLEVDLKNAFKRYAPQSVKDKLSPEIAAKLWDAVDRYTTIGFMGGFDAEHRDTIWGPKFAAKISF